MIAGAFAAPMSAEMQGTPPSIPSGPAFATSVHSSGHYLLDQYGSPFLMVGDSGWEMVSNIGTADVDSYLTTRASQGFNTGLVNMIASPYDNSASSWASFEGFLPFVGTGPSDFDITKPVAPYWAKVDYVLASARSHGITLLCDSLGECCYQDNSGFYARVGQANLNTFGTWLANRYAGYPNVIWLWGADYWASLTAANDAYLIGMANAARAAAGSKLHTIEGYNDGIYFPTNTASDNLSTDDSSWSRTTHDASHAQVDINHVYDSRLNSQDVNRAYALSSPRPAYFGEGCYEGNTKGSVTGNAATQRAYAYNSILNGACGWAYGHNTVWYFGSGWQSDLSTTMVTHNGIAATFWKSLSWWTLVPDSGAVFATSGATSAAVDVAGSVGVVYGVQSTGIVIAMTKMRGTVTASWFDPTNGSTTSIGSFANTGTHTFTQSSANSAGGTDWLLVLAA